MYRHNSGLQAQSVLYYKGSIDPSDAAAPKVLIDPNALSADGTVSLGTTAFSKDGRFLAYGLSQSGSDWINGKARRPALFHRRTRAHDLLDSFYPRARALGA